MASATAPRRRRSTRRAPADNNGFGVRGVGAAAAFVTSYFIYDAILLDHGGGCGCDAGEARWPDGSGGLRSISSRPSVSRPPCTCDRHHRTGRQHILAPPHAGDKTISHTDVPVHSAPGNTSHNTAGPQGAILSP